MPVARRSEANASAASCRSSVTNRSHQGNGKMSVSSTKTASSIGNGSSPEQGKSQPETPTSHSSPPEERMKTSDVFWTDGHLHDPFTLPSRGFAAPGDIAVTKVLAPLSLPQNYKGANADQKLSPIAAAFTPTCRGSTWPANGIQETGAAGLQLKDENLTVSYGAAAIGINHQSTRGLTISGLYDVSPKQLDDFFNVLLYFEVLTKSY